MLFRPQNSILKERCKRDILYCHLQALLFQQIFSNWPFFGSQIWEQRYTPAAVVQFLECTTLWMILAKAWVQPWSQAGSGPWDDAPLSCWESSSGVALGTSGEVEGVWYLSGRWIFPLNVSTFSFWIEHFTVSPQTKGRCEADKLVLPIGYLYFGWSPERSRCFYDVSSFCLYVLQV